MVLTIVCALAGPIPPPPLAECCNYSVARAARALAGPIPPPPPPPRIGTLTGGARR